MRAAHRNAVTLAAIALALGSAGCSFTSTCNRDEDTVVISDGLVFGNTYISAPNDAEHRGPFAHFPPARTLVFEHHLPSVPYQIAIWLAFQDHGTLAPAAGNSSLMLRPETAEDDKTIRIKNDTCSEFWVWLQASVPTYSEGQGATAGMDTDPPGTDGSAGAQ